METNLLENDLIKMIDDSECENSKELINHLKCVSCNKIMLNPTVCLKCNKSICHSCHKSCINPNLQTSRHLKAYLDMIKFNCKYLNFGCKKKLNYFQLNEHLLSCEYRLLSNSFSLNIKENKSKINNSYFQNGECKDLKYIDNKNDISNIFKNSSTILVNNFNDYNKNVVFNNKFVCFVCNDNHDFKNIEELIKHKKSNFCKNKTFNPDNFNDYQNYREDYETCKKKYLSDIKYLDFQNLEFFQKFFSAYNNEYENKKNLIAALMEKENELTKENVSLDFNIKKIMEQDKDFSNTLKIRDDLQETKINLEIKLSEKFTEIKKLKLENEKNLEFIKIPFLKKIEELENFEINMKKLISDLQPGLVPSTKQNNINSCGVCFNENPKTPKILCETCQVVFCENKCVTYCNGEICKTSKKMLCPLHNKKCSLCDKNNFCDLCQKKCYYNNCQNTFCPSCYKKNEHQTRSTSISCKFFTCERDQVNDCIMCSLFCQKCEKRLCKNCIKKEISHFPFLK